MEISHAGPCNGSAVPNGLTTELRPTSPRPSPAKMPQSSPTSPPRSAPRSRPADRYHRGDIWFVASSDEHPVVGTELWPNRPAVIVSNNVSSNRSGFVQVVYLTTSTRKRSGPTHIELGSPLGDGKSTMALCEQIHTVDVSRLSRKLGCIAQHQLTEIDAAICYSLSIGHRDDYALYKKWEAHIKTYGIDLAQEISALSCETTDARVESLTRALHMVASERDALQQIIDSRESMPAILDDVRTAVQNAHAKNEGDQR